MRSFTNKQRRVLTRAGRRVCRRSPLIALVALAAALLMAGQRPGVAQVPPPQAANAGFTTVLFNDDFTQRSNLSGDLACAGTPQTAPWKQGWWWEGQGGSTGTAPCSQISIVPDPVFGTNVLDLEWLPSQTDAQDATAISTYPLDDVSPHFAFRHGYLEVVARETPFASGVWPSIVMGSDESNLAATLPPYYTASSPPVEIPPVEMDVLEFFGPLSQSNIPGGGEIGTLKEEYSTGRVGGYTSQAYPPPVDVTKPHTYGWLWTAGPQWQGGQVCQYIDNMLQGCLPTSAASEAQQMFLVLSMGVGCNFTPSNRSCLNGLSRADLLVSRVTVFGE
jgi:hypothetical protein